MGLLFWNDQQPSFLAIHPFVFPLTCQLDIKFSKNNVQKNNCIIAFIYASIFYSLRH